VSVSGGRERLWQPAAPFRAFPEGNPKTGRQAGRRGGRTTERSEGVSAFPLAAVRGWLFRRNRNVTVLIVMQGCVDLQPSPNHGRRRRDSVRDPLAAADDQH
jgi:hypothetical protein